MGKILIRRRLTQKQKELNGADDFWDVVRRIPLALTESDPPLLRESDPFDRTGVWYSLSKEGSLGDSE